MEASSKPEEQKEMIKERVSHNLNFKSVVFKLPKKGQFEMNVYEWKQEDGAEKPWWERVSGPFLVDTEEKAHELALEHLQIFAKEMIADDVSEKDREWLREYSGDPDAAFFDPANFTAQMLVGDDGEEGEYSDILASKVAIVHDLYLVETDGQWHTGILANENVVQCWQKFMTLEQAVNSLQNDFEV